MTTLVQQSETLPGIYSSNIPTTNAKNISFEGTRGSVQCEHPYDVTWLLQFTKTYAILHNLFKRIPYFEGSFIQQLNCLQPIQLHKIYGVKPNHIALKSETLCIKSPKPAPSKHFQFLPKILAWYCICHSCSNHSNLEIEAECLTKTIHT